MYPSGECDPWKRPGSSAKRLPKSRKMARGYLLAETPFQVGLKGGRPAHISEEWKLTVDWPIQKVILERVDTSRACLGVSLSWGLNWASP